MKNATLEIVTFNANDIITVTSPCGEDIPVIPTECQDPDFD